MLLWQKFTDRSRHHFFFRSSWNADKPDVWLVRLDQWPDQCLSCRLFYGSNRFTDQSARARSLTRTSSPALPPFASASISTSHGSPFFSALSSAGVLTCASSTRLQETGETGETGCLSAGGRRRQDLRQRSSLFTFMSCWLATLPRPTRCQSMSAEAHCGLERHQNIIVEPGCWVAAQEIRRNIFLHSHGGVFVSVCVCVSVKVSPFRQRGVWAELLFVWTLDYCCEGWEIRYLGGDEWN